MTDDDKKKIKAELKRRIAETQKMILNLKEQSKPVSPDNAIGRITRMDAIQQRSVAEAHLQKSEETLYCLEESLIKIEQKSFGICMRCKADIPFERILIMPEVRFCTKCAAL